MRAPSPFFAVFIFVLATRFLFCDQPPSGPDRPAAVPDGYVITPFGYFHRSCVRQLKKGETLLSGGRAIRHADGTLEDVPVCGYANFPAERKIVSSRVSEVARPAITHSYIEDATVSSTASSYGQLSASWVVPPAPISKDGQTVYFFPGLVDGSHVGSILQPVLGWWSGTWNIASWNCCISGTAWSSTELIVQSGDTIQGNIQSTCGPGTLSCPTWNITTEDVTSGQSTTLSNSPSEGQTFNLAYAGTLEVYDIVQCSDYPSNGSLTFLNVSLYDDNFDLITNPPWTQYVDTAVSPQCNYGVPLQANQVTVDYAYAGFTLTDSSGNLVVDAGGASGACNITVTDAGGFTGSVTLTASNLPSGVTASFDTNPTSGGNVLTLTAGAVTIPGTYRVTVTGKSGSRVASTIFILTIPEPTPTFTDSPTSTSTGTDSPTATVSSAATGTPSDSPTFTNSSTHTASPTITQTWTRTLTWTPSPVIVGRTQAVIVYPNPSSGFVWFAFPPGGQKVDVKVYGLAGQKVADLGASYQEAQEGLIPWNGGGGRLATGIYLVMLEEDGRRYTAKFAILGSGLGGGEVPLPGFLNGLYGRH